MSERIPVIAANWKMHKTAAEAVEFCDVFLPRVEGSRSEIVICPPFLALPAVAEAVGSGPVMVAAQNMYFAAEGAFTGEVSARMLVDAGAKSVVLGHSERRQLFNESDDALARTVPVALESGLTPILCVGETEDERERDETDRIIRRQIDAGLSRVPSERLAEVVIAYEPVWAIGTGKVASPAQAEDACGFVRALVAGRDEAAAERIRVLYGGSVKPANATELLGREEIDGALVGGASLDPEDFAAIVEAAG